MSTGPYEFKKVKSTIKKANKLGFRLTSDNHDLNMYLYSVKNKLPGIYNEWDYIHKGSLEEIESFLDGINWARDYDEDINLSNKEDREKKEQIIRNNKLIEQIRNSDNMDEEDER